MKTTKLLRCALCAAVFAALSLVGCEKLDLYSISSPSDLQSKIDSIANSKTKTGDTTYLTITTATVGAEDFSSGWWTVFSDYFTIPAGKKLHLEFKNTSNCAKDAKNYENWVLLVTNPVSDRSSSSYSEYFALRSDAYGWSGKMSSENAAYAYNSDSLSYSYPDVDGDGDLWNDFRNAMAEATVTMDIEHSAAGNVYVTATAVGKNGTTLVEKYSQQVGTKDINAFLTCEESYLNIKKAYLLPSTITGDDIVTNTTTKTTYRADLKATITTTSNKVYTYTYSAEKLPYDGYGTFLTTEAGHLAMDPVGTYYCALADTLNSSAWFYPYSSTTNVGAVDNTTAWWSAFTSYTAVTGEGYFHYKFVNYSSEVNNWNNWALALTNGQSRSGTNYKECFILRADNYGWGTYYVGANLTNNYDWDTFKSDLDGATVEISLKISAENSTTASSKSAVSSKALSPGVTIKRFLKK